MAVNWDIVKGKWNELKGEARKQWGDLADDDWEQIAGDRDKLIGMLQGYYGWEQKEAEQHVDEYFSRINLSA